MVTRNILILLSFLGLLSGCGGADQSADIPAAEPAEATNADIGDYVVHFSAQSTDQLPTDIAQAYGIVRSKNRAMLNVTVLREADNTAVAAGIAVKAVNLTGQLKEITMRRIDEQDAIYYIGEVGVANRETLIFDISVTPEGASAAADVRFKRQFFTD
jgi:hypothetical protein